MLFLIFRYVANYFEAFTVVRLGVVVLIGIPVEETFALIDVTLSPQLQVTCAGLN